MSADATDLTETGGPGTDGHPGPVPSADHRPLVSIIVPCRNEAAYIGRCLESILATTYPRERLEVLIVDGASDDGTGEIVQQWAKRYPPIRLLANPRRIVPSGLNLGIRAARGDIIVRMDAHAFYPPTYVSDLVRALETSEADNVGGSLVVLPADASRVSRGIAAALSHPFGVGNAAFRAEGTEPAWVDTVPYGCYRRSVFTRIGLFDEELVRNQDDELNQRLVSRGGRILLVPGVRSYYYARRSFKQLARMYYQYGLFKPLAARRQRRVGTLRQLLPVTFLLSLVGSTAAAPVSGFAAGLLLLVAGSYAAVVGWCGARALHRLGAGATAAFVAALPLIHVSYGAGFLRGLGYVLVRGTRAGPDPASVPLSR